MFPVILKHDTVKIRFYCNLCIMSLGKKKGQFASQKDRGKYGPKRSIRQYVSIL